MHSLRNSINKRLYTLRLANERCARQWQGQYWQDQGGERLIRCRECRKFDARKPACSIGFGSPIRKCVTAAAEANLHSLAGKSLLEIGFGKHSIPRHLVTGAGGTWTGIEPMMSRENKAGIGKGGYGHVADIPFADDSFDIVVGIQSLEHWAEPLPDPELETGYDKGLREIHRVLKPGGSIYFDAPIHLHGHEMFIAGDIPRIRRLFDPACWHDVRIERWREDYAPLERYATPESDLSSWPAAISSYPAEMTEAIRDEKSVWLLTIKATKQAG